jgi:succinate dehydrogenase/fumarate reductase-like Fe-S protein
MRITFVRGGVDGAEVRRNDYEIPDTGLSSISSALQYVARNYDGSIGYYLSCRRGMCACCVVRANGKIETACVTAVTDGMLIEPVKATLLVKDTVVDLSMARENQLSFGDES